MSLEDWFKRLSAPSNKPQATVTNLVTATKDIWTGLGQIAIAGGVLAKETAAILTLDPAESKVLKNLGKGWDFVSKEVLNAWDEHMTDPPSISVLDRNRRDIFDSIGNNEHQGRKYAEETWISCERIKILKKEIEKIQSDPDYRLKFYKASVLVLLLKGIADRDAFNFRAKNDLIEERKKLVKERDNPSQNSRGRYNLQPAWNTFFRGNGQQSGKPVQARIDEIDQKIASFDMDFNREIELPDFEIDKKTGRIVKQSTTPKKIKIEQALEEIRSDTDFMTQTHLISTYIIEFQRNVNAIEYAVRNDPSDMSKKIVARNHFSLPLQEPDPKRVINPQAGGGSTGGAPPTSIP